MARQQLDDFALEPNLVISVDETVVEDPARLVDPQTVKALRVVAFVGGDHQEALENQMD